MDIQTNLFDFLYDNYKITKPIRLIECFAGYGSQALSLKYLGVEFEHHKICEWATKSIQAYKDAHFTNDNTNYSKDLSQEQVIDFLFKKGVSMNYNEPMSYEQIKRKGEEWQRTTYNNIIATHNLVNISQVKGKDLEITDTDKYDYILTYSFPCQDLSLAGKRAGMEKDSGTRSGLLWEVERILDECKTLGNLPKILLMENVPEVVGSNNIEHFKKWRLKLEQLGYSNYDEILNATGFDVPQSRRRCFMVSILGEYNYNFPKEKKLTKKLKDILENNVDEKFYLTKEKIEKVKSWGGYEDPFNDIERDRVCSSLTTHCGKDSNGMQLVKDDENLKKELCNKLIEENLVEEFDVIKHSYTQQIIKGNKKCVEKSDGVMITLTTRGDCVGVCVRGNYSPSKHNASRIVDTKGLAPTVMENHGTVTAIVEEEYQGMFQYARSDKFMKGKDRFTPNKELADTLQTTLKEGEVVKIGNCDKEIVEFGNYYTWKDNQGNINTQCNRAANENNYALTIACSQAGNVFENNLRIRKLTPKECFRLMGVKDEDYENIEKNQSDASLYHLAGDSIVVNVLMGIFKQFL